MTVHKPANNEIELSIIILSYNTAELTKQTIESIYRATELSTNRFEIIVLDNASQDNSVSVLRQLSQKNNNLHIIEHKENSGFSKGNNIASKQAKGEYLLFLNSDIIVQNRGIDVLLSYLKEHKTEAQFVGGKLLNKDHSDQASCGPFYTLPVVFAALFLRGDYWGLTRYSPNQVKQVDWVSGACILTKKISFEKIGRFDEGIFMYMEEIDLLYRAKKQGMHACFVPKARFIHLGSASSGGKTYPILQVYKGFLYFYKKHYDPSAVALLKGMLQLKARVAILLGTLTGRRYLIETYGKAQKIASMA